MSPLWTAGSLARATGGSAHGGFDATGVSIDTRSLLPGDVFIALVGDRSDGHSHVAAALAQGAAGAIVHADTPLHGDARLVRVADTGRALTDLGRFARDRFTGKLVAVTGSVGKTTTKEMLRTALASLGPTHAASASHNNHWGVPLTLSRLDPDAAFCVSEIGMNHPGEIAPLASLTRPDVAIITSIGATHIGHMGSLAAIAREKGALVDSLRPGGAAIIPADAVGADEIAARASARGVRVIRFGDAGSKADARIASLSLAADATRFVALLGGTEIAVRLAAPGRHMAMNALACLAAVAGLEGAAPDIAAGATPAATWRGRVETAARALSDFRPGDGRGARRPLLGGSAWLLDESYNASGASVRASLEVLRLLEARRRVVVLGDMLELGDFAREEHESLAPAVRESADIVYCCGHMMNKLYQKLPPALQGAAAADAQALASIVAADLRPGDAVLVKGSYGSRMRDVVSALAARSA